MLSGGDVASNHGRVVIFMTRGDEGNQPATSQRQSMDRRAEFEEVLTRALMQNFMFHSALGEGFARGPNAFFHPGIWPPFLRSESSAGSGLTEEALNNLPKVTVDENTNLSTVGDCGITLDPFNVGDEVITLSCGHCYKAEALKGWLRNHNTCPICREQVHQGS